MNSSIKLLLVPVFAFVIMVAGITAALASEVGGELSSSGTSTTSYRDGALVASVSEQESTTTTASPATSERTGGRSSTRKAPYGGATPQTANDPIIIIDGGSLASSEEFSGTGGGFDPETERIIAAANPSSDDNFLSPSDAVAFNNSSNPLLANTDLVASVEDTGIGSARVWTAVILGLALLGLAGYAVNALVSYRRENDL